jgi:hypothetical protein
VLQPDPLLALLVSPPRPAGFSYSLIFGFVGRAKPMEIVTIW